MKPQLHLVFNMVEHLMTCLFSANPLSSLVYLPSPAFIPASHQLSLLCSFLVSSPIIWIILSISDFFARSSVFLLTAVNRSFTYCSNCCCCPCIATIMDGIHLLDLTAFLKLVSTAEVCCVYTRVLLLLGL